MATTSTPIERTAPTLSGPRAFLRRLTDGDQIAHLITLIFAASILLITSLLVYQLWVSSVLPRHKFGWHFLVTSVWDPVFEQFGALPFIYGTVVTSIVALIIAVPLGLGAAIFLAELAPRKVSDSLAFLVDLLAAVPSVIYGLLGIFIVVPIVRTVIAPFLQATLGYLPLFHGSVVWRGDADRGYGSGDHGRALHRFCFARSTSLGAGRSARGGPEPRCDAMGIHMEGRGSVCRDWNFWLRVSRAGAGAWGNDGSDDGDRKRSENQRISSGSGLYDRCGDRQ